MSNQTVAFILAVAAVGQGILAWGVLSIRQRAESGGQGRLKVD